MRNIAGLSHLTVVSLRGIGEFSFEVGETPTEMIWEVVYCMKSPSSFTFRSINAPPLSIVSAVEESKHFTL